MIPSYWPLLTIYLLGLCCLLYQLRVEFPRDIYLSSIALPPPSPQQRHNKARLLNALSPFTIEGTWFAKSHLYGDKAKNIPGARYNAKYFYKDLWESNGCGLNFEWIHGKCYWCAVNDTQDCRYGKFAVHVFRDDATAYSLETRGTMDMITMRSAHDSRNGKSELDQLYFTCSALNAPLPENQDGMLHLEDFPALALPVAAYKPVSSSSTRYKTAVCTKAFYGKGINQYTIIKFIVHYLENWKFDYIILYELGTTVGLLLKDVIAGDAKLLNYLKQGRLVLVDFRDDLQRAYGPIRGDMTLFSSKNGQMMVSADCINRAKSTLVDVDWVLLVDWDEYLAIGPMNELGTQTFADFAATRQAANGKSRLQVIEFERHRPVSDDSICLDCDNLYVSWDQVHWATYANKHEIDQFLNTTSKTEPAKKYAVRIDSTEIPRTWAYGVHVISRCAYRHGRGNRLMVPIVDVYIRHYRCLNRAICVDNALQRIQLNWAFEFSSSSST